MIKYLVLFSISITLFSCKNDDMAEDVELVIPQDPAIQRQIDIELIDNYILDNGYSEFKVDTTLSGVRYIILNYGDTLVSDNSIEENDSVEFNYTGRLIDNLIFSTTVDSIAQNEGLTLEEPISILYMESGENIEDVFIKGFAEGITKTFKEVGLNSHILLLLPSDLAFGRQSRVFTKESEGQITEIEIPANAVIICDVMPIKLVKQ